MSTPNIKAFFRLAHKHFDTLEALFDSRRGMRETELRAHLDEHSSHTASAGYVFRQFQAHRLIEPMPEETASFELTPQVRDLFQTFRRKQALSTPNAIKPYLDRLQELTERLDQHTDQSSGTGVQRVLEPINTEIENIRTLSRSNREAVLNRVTELRAGTTTQSVRERFETINKLLEDYVTPLQDIVQNQGAFERLFSQLSAMLEEAESVFTDDPSLTRDLKSTAARLRRVRQSVVENFEVARREAMRLYEQQKVNNDILQGASSLLNRVHHEGPESLDLIDEMKLGSFTMRTVFQDEGLRAYLHKMVDYEPPDPDPIQEPSALEAPSLLDKETLVDTARSACPIPDAMGWLVETLEQDSPRRALRAYRYLLQSPALDTTFGEGRREYDLGETVLTAVPVQVDVDDGESDHS